MPVSNGTYPKTLPNSKMATDVKPLPEDDVKEKGGVLGPGDNTTAMALAEAIRREHELTFRDAVRLYPAAIGWSAFVSIGVIMLAFDPQILGGFFATPRFEQDFGYYYAPDDEVRSASLQSTAYDLRPTIYSLPLDSIDFC